MIKEHPHTICHTHEGDLIALSNGRIKENIVFTLVNAVWNRFKRNLYYLKTNQLTCTFIIVNETP